MIPYNHKYVLLNLREKTVLKSVLSSVQCIYKRYFVIDQQIAQHPVKFSECVSNPPSLLGNSNNYPSS